MITDVGKTTPSLFMGDGSIYTFVNETIAATSWTYQDTNGANRYTTAIPASSLSAKNRALHFYRSYPGTNYSATKIPVVFIPPTVTTSSGGASTQFLYECIAPQIAVNKEQVFQLLFWTNVTTTEKFIQNNGETIYDQTNVLKFSNDELGDIETDSLKVLCSANINFEMLTPSLSSRMQVPVIRKIIVLDMVNDGNVITDFAGGGGNGLRIHNHADNNNGGFAFSVYAPSGIMRVLSWE